MAQTQHDLPSIQALFSESWDVFKKTWINLLVLNLIAWGFFVVATIIFVLLFFLLGPGHTLFVKPLVLSSSFWGITALFLIALFVVYFLISTFFRAGTLLIVADKTKIPSLSTVMSASFVLLIPLASVEILTFLFIGGGFFLFLIPGIIIAIFLSFASYEVVIGNHHGTAALSRSYTIITAHFWELLGRILLIWFLSFLLNWVSRSITHGGVLLSILFVVIQLAFSWFVTCYWVTLYKQAVHATVKSTQKTLLPLIIMALVGWIIAIVILILISQSFPSILQTIQKNFQQKNHPLPYHSLPSSRIQMN